MNFLVCISRTPDTTSKITFEADSRKLKEDGLVFILNPYDEWYALVQEKYPNATKIACQDNHLTKLNCPNATIIYCLNNPCWKLKC